MAGAGAVVAQDSFEFRQGCGRVPRGDVGEERRCRPAPVGARVGVQQVRRMLGQDPEPRGGGFGAEEECGRAGIGLPCDLYRFGSAWALIGGELEHAGGAGGQRHQQVPGGGEEVGVETGGPVWVGAGAGAVEGL